MWSCGAVLSPVNKAGPEPNTASETKGGHFNDWSGQFFIEKHSTYLISLSLRIHKRQVKKNILKIDVSEAKISIDYSSNGNHPVYQTMYAQFVTDISPYKEVFEPKSR